MQNQRKTERNTLLIYFGMAFLVFVCQLRKNGMMYLSTDELGQWSIAAWLAGSDWSSIASRNSYYSYFYAIPLSMLFRFCQSPINMYRVATVLNALLLSSTIFWAYGICKKVCRGKQDNKICGLIALNCTLFTSNIIMANLTWGESLLIAVSWLVLYLVMDIFAGNSVRTIRLCGLAVLLMVGYMTHQRYLGVVVSGILIICLAGAKNRISKKQLFCFLTAIVVMVMLHSFMKNNVLEHVYHMEFGRVDGNDYSGQIGKLAGLRTAQGIIKLLRVAIGQIYYIGVSTGFIGFLGIIYIFKCLKKVIIQKKSEYSSIFYLYLFIALAGIATIIISSIFFSSPVRIDHIIYGRYNEIILGFLLLLGWLELREDGGILQILGVALVGGLISVISKASIDILAIPGAIQPICVGGIAMLWHQGMRVIEIYVFATMLLFLVSFLAKRKRRCWYVISLVGITVFFVFSGLYVNNKIVLPTKQAWQGMAELTEKSESDENKDWVWLEDGMLGIKEKALSENVTPSLLQFLLKDRSLYYLDESKLDTVDLSQTNVLTKICPIYLLGFQAIDRSGDVYLLNKALRKDDGERNGYSLPLDWFSTQVTQGDNFRSHGKSEAVLFGPYITLRPGRYMFEIQLKLFHGNEVLGTVDAISGEEIFYKAEIKREDLTTGNCIIKVPVTICEMCPQFELRVLTAEGTDLQIEKINVTYNE